MENNTPGNRIEPEAAVSPEETSCPEHRYVLQKSWRLVQAQVELCPLPQAEPWKSKNTATFTFSAAHLFLQVAPTCAETRHVASCVVWGHT